MKLRESYFYNAAVYYLQRYSSSTENLRQVLHRKMKRRAFKGEEIPADAKQWLEAAVQKCVAQGLVNDRLYTEGKINDLRRAGRSRNYIFMHLQQKGVDKVLIADLWGDDPDSELNAAKRMVEKKRLGRDQTPEGYRKDLAKLARAGFSLAIARAALFAN